MLGAGPAGIAAAAQLAAAGHSVTLFDRASAPGGMAQETIPEERLPEPILRREIEAVLKSSGDRIRRRYAEIGADCTLDQILAEGFDAALVTLGLSDSARLHRAERPAQGVYGALEFLSRAKRPQAPDLSGQAVLVLGAGNTAIDAAITARRCGSQNVAIVYRRSFGEMPAWPNERDEAMRAGVHFLILTQPVSYMADEHGKLTGLNVVRSRLGPAGPDGRPQPQPIPGTEHVIPADIVIEALGQQADPEMKRALRGLEFSRSGRVRTAVGSLATTRAGVFAAGDIVNGGTTVVQAVAEGARAASEINRYLEESGHDLNKKTVAG